MAGLAAGLLLLLAAVTIGSTVTAFVFQKQRDDLEQQRNEASDAREDAREQQWRAMLGEAHSLTLTHQSGQRFRALARLQEALALARQQGLTEEDRLRFRNVALAAFALPDIEEVSAGPTLEGGVDIWEGGFDVDAHFGRFARSDSKGNVRVIRVADDRVLAEIPGKGNKAFLRLSRDGAHLSVLETGAGGHRLAVWQVTDQGARCIHQAAAPVWRVSVHHYGAFSPDSRRLAYLRQDRQVEILDLATGRPRGWPVPRTPTALMLSVSPDSRSLAIDLELEGRHVTQVRNLETGELRYELAHPAPVEWHAWRPGGTLMAFACRDRHIYLWDLQDRQTTMVLDRNDSLGCSLTFTHAGDRLFSVDWTRLARLWDVRTGQLLMVFPGRGNILRFRADDQQLAIPSFSGAYLQFFRFASGAEVRRVNHRTPEDIGNLGRHSLTFSARDRLLAADVVKPGQANTPPSGVALIDPVTGRKMAFIEVPSLYALGYEKRLTDRGVVKTAVVTRAQARGWLSATQCADGNINGLEPRRSPGL